MKIDELIIKQQQLLNLYRIVLCNNEPKAAEFMKNKFKLKATVSLKMLFIIIIN